MTEKRFSTMRSFLVTLALLTGGCASEAADTPVSEKTAQQNEAESFARASEVAGQPADQQASGSGTLTLGGTTYAFDVRLCNLSGEKRLDSALYGESPPRLHGQGRTAEDKPFQVFVHEHQSERSWSNTITQTVDLQRAGAPVLAAARSSPDGSRWNNAYGSKDGPLFSVEGQTLTAEGTFAHQDDAAKRVGTGQLKATCSE